MGGTNSSINNTLRLTLKNLNTSTNSIITSNDRVIDAFGKLQAQISNISSSGSSVSISNGNNFTIYNTADQVTNYERFRGFWNSNIFYLSNQSNGSGQRRAIFLNVNTAGLVVNDTASVGGGIRVISNPQTSATSIFGVLGVLNGSNTVQDGATIAPYFNQSGTAIGNALKVSPFIGSVGAGINLLNLGTNTGADNTGTHTSRFVVTSNGNVGFGTDSPTHAVTLPSGASWVSYNTTDQTTNFERVRAYWTGTSFNIRGESGGTGQLRDIYIGNNNPLSISASGQIFLPALENGVVQTDGFVLRAHPTAPTFRAMRNVPYDFGIGNTNNSAIRINTNGNVGIGTTADAGYKLDVNGASRFQGSMMLQSSNPIDLFFSHGTGAGISSNNGTLSFRSGSPYAQNMFLSSLGNLLIGTTVDIASSILTINSTTKGFLPPRQTQSQRIAINSPAIGLIVYQTDNTEGLYIYKSTGWTLIG